MQKKKSFTHKNTVADSDNYMMRNKVLHTKIIAADFGNQIRN